MIAFDTDVLVELHAGSSDYVARASAVPPEEQGVPVVVVEEILRGRLHGIRLAEAGKAKINLPQAYELFSESVRHLQELTLLSYTSQADDLFRKWRGEKIRIPSHDLSIAAICVAHSATFISRNQRDFEQVPNLSVAFWG